MRLVLWTGLLLVQISFASAATCERLQQSLTYTQEEAPRDLSGVLPVVVERVNRVLEGVVDVEVEWHGDDLQGRVGEHTVQCKVTRLAKVLDDRANVSTYTDDTGREVVTQCFHVPFTILDTNECTLPADHPMRHQCHSSAICVNTIGAYECLCPRDDTSLNPPPGTTVKDEAFWDESAAQQADRNEWEVAFNRTSRTTCASLPSTHGCCQGRVHAKDGAVCRRDFRCPVDPCGGGSVTAHDCVPSAECVRTPSPVQHPNYRCECPTGLLGNGHTCRPGIDPPPEPKVMFDGVTPTEETVKQNYYCDCTKPVIDACSGFPSCTGKHEICVAGSGNVPRCDCKPGYVMHDTYGCVDESPPLMKLKHDPYGDQTLRLKQGDVYKEYFVDIQDENAEEYLRSLKIAYSRPMPYGCLTEIGEFHVNYTVATPWTSPPYVRLTRRVIIEDVNECQLDVQKFKITCPELVPQCDVDAGAKCVNTIGSYTCQCPKHTEGDGFLPGLKTSPTGYEGGTGCRDVSIPVIHLNGPNPKVFSVCRCGGIKGVMGRSDDGAEKDSALHAGQQQHYAADIQEIIRKTAGAELCATHQLSKPAPADCVQAYDETYKGRVDLSNNVKVGDPVQKSELHWSVPYDVSDVAGNKAATVWRDIIVEEVELEDVASKMRREFEKEKEAAIRKAVDQALLQERNQSNSRSGTMRSSNQKCPDCPKCNCQERDGLDEAACMALCEARMESCAVNEQSWIVRCMLWLEGFFPASLAPVLLGVVALFATLLFIRFVISFFVEQKPYQPSYDTNPEHLQNHITVYRPSNVPSNGGTTPMNGGYGNSSFGGGGGFGDSVTPGGSGSMSSPSGSYGGMNGGMNGGNAPRSAPPRSSISLGHGSGSLFSPTSGESRSYTSVAGTMPSPVTDIYEQSPLITPNRRGDGVRRRSPFSR